MAGNTSKLLTTLEAASQEDLDVVDADIQALESQLKLRYAVRKVLCSLLGVVPVKPKHKSRMITPAEADGTLPMQSKSSQERRLQIAKILLKGPQFAEKLRDQIGAAPQGWDRTLEYPWFAKQPDGSYRLTEEGRRAVTGNKVAEV